jgi:hypothetical protein
VRCEIIADNIKESDCDGIRSDMAVFARGTEKTSVRIAGPCAEK